MRKAVAKLALAAVACVAFVGLGPPADAQVLYGSLVGNVADASGAVVPEVTVTIIHAQTGQKRSAKTNEVGVYNLVAIPSGTYTIEFAKPGFATSTKDRVEVTINNVTRVDQTLRVGAVAESVEVSAQAAALQTDRAEVRLRTAGKMLSHGLRPPAAVGGQQGDAATP